MSSDKNATAYQVLAGVASLPLTPPLGLDMVGFLRRWAPARAYGERLEVSVLVLEAEGSRVAIGAFDGIFTPGDYGRRIRAAVAEGAQAEMDAVLFNSSHTHAAPPPPGLLKLGGTTFDLREDEALYAEVVIATARSAAQLAAERMETAFIRMASRTFDLGVNRRQRTDEGTVLGWNPEGLIDRDVDVVRVDTSAGRPLVTLIAYGCHPVVIGPDVAEYSSDFVGPLRNAVRQWTGGECIYLQGCAGNVLPLEAWFDHVGPEVEFGRALAISAIAAWQEANPRVGRPVQEPWASAVPIAVWRLAEFDDIPSARLAAREVNVSLPLADVPTRAEILDIQKDRERVASELQRTGAPRSEWNPVSIHAVWAKRVADSMDAGTLEDPVETIVQVLQIGDIGVAALPGEPFTEIGLEIKRLATTEQTIVLGCSNDAVGYMSTAEEYLFGGYEPALAQRHYGRPAPFDPIVARILVDAAVEGIGSLVRGTTR